MALLLAGGGCQGGGAATGNRSSPPDRSSAALPSDPAAEEEELCREVAEVLLSGAERLPEHLRRCMNPLSTGGLFHTLPDSVVSTSPCAGSSEAAAICGVWAQIDAMWNARDAERFSRLFADDVTFRFVQRGQSLDGRTTIFEHFREGFPQYAADLRHHTRLSAIHRIAPGVFTADGSVEILRVAAGGDAPPAVLRTFAIFAVMSRKDEVWIVRALRVYRLPTGADDAEAGRP